VRKTIVIGGALVLGAIGATLGITGGSGSDRGGLPVDVVARVGDRTISQQTAEHWMRVEGLLSHDGGPVTPERTWVEPRPPGYTGCIRNLENPDARPFGVPRHASQSVLKGECQKLYVDLRAKTMIFLILTVWEENIAREQDIAPSNAEVTKEFARYVAREFPAPGEFALNLRAYGMGRDDELLRVRKNMAELRIRERLARALGAVRGDRARERDLITKPLERWVPLTTCRAGWVVLWCREYRGPQRL
jgi:hypothetical protein